MGNSAPKDGTTGVKKRERGGADLIPSAIGKDRGGTVGNPRATGDAEVSDVLDRLIFVVGCWLLVVGWWLIVVCCWLIVSDRW